MSKKCLVIYGIIVLLAALAYSSTRSFIIDTTMGKIRISNVTVNYVLLYMIVGALSPHIAWRLFPKARKWIAIPFTLGITLLLLVLLSYWYPLRW